MAAIDFPAAPVVGDQHTENGVTYTWDGNAWVLGKSQIPPVGPSVQIKRTPTNNNPPAALKEGELAVEMGTPLRLWVGVPTTIDPSGKKLLAFMGAGDPYVDITGDTMTGDLKILKASPSLLLDKLDAATQSNSVKGMLNGALRWVQYLGTAAAESGGNVGSNYALQAADDAGNTIAPPILSGSRATNRLAVAGDPIAALDIATKQYVDAAGAAAVPMTARMTENLFINGDMSVSQELVETSTGAILTNGFKYACDLWYINHTVGNGGNLFGQRGAMLYNTPGKSIPKYLSVTTSPAGNYGAAAGDFATVLQFMEGNRMAKLNYGGGAGALGAQPSTISFWLSHNAAANITFSASIRNAAVTRSYIHDFTTGAANSWAYYSFVLPGCPDGVWNFDHQLWGYFGLCFGAGANFKSPTQDAWIDTTAQQKFASNAISNAFATTNWAMNITGLQWLPGSVAPTAAQSLLMMRGIHLEMPLVQRYFRQFKWTTEGSSGGAQQRLTSTHQIPAMKTPPGVSRVSIGSSTNIRGGDTVNFVTCSATNEQSVLTSLESNAAGYTQAINVVENLSARF